MTPHSPGTRYRRSVSGATRTESFTSQATACRRPSSRVHSRARALVLLQAESLAVALPILGNQPRRQRGRLVAIHECRPTGPAVNLVFLDRPRGRDEVPGDRCPCDRCLAAQPQMGKVHGRGSWRAPSFKECEVAVSVTGVCFSHPTFGKPLLHAAPGLSRLRAGACVGQRGGR